MGKDWMVRIAWIGMAVCIAVAGLSGGRREIVPDLLPQ